MDRITINPEQCGGRPCIRGMRIRVKDVLDMLAGGATADEHLSAGALGVDLADAGPAGRTARERANQILADYPDLEAEDIRACLAYSV